MKDKFPFRVVLDDAMPPDLMEMRSGPFSPMPNEIMVIAGEKLKKGDVVYLKDGKAFAVKNVPRGE